MNSIAQAFNKDKFYNSNGFSMANRFDSKEKLETGQFDVEADKHWNKRRKTSFKI